MDRPAEKEDQTALALLPGLQYLQREARDAGLAVVAGILGKAANDVVHWIHQNENQNHRTGDRDQ